MITDRTIMTLSVYILAVQLHIAPGGESITTASGETLATFTE